MLNVISRIDQFSNYLKRLSLSLRNRNNEMTLSIGNVVVGNLLPLGQVQTPGLTKAGRLSFTGLIDGQRVKVYETHSNKQLLLRKALERTTFGKNHLPKVIAAEDNIVVEEWIVGENVLQLNEQSKNTVKNIIFTMQNSQEMSAIAEEYSRSFCYLIDYLYPRVLRWSVINNINRFIQKWKEDYDELMPIIPIRISHSDLSAANIIKEHTSGRFIVIDNELLGSGHGWILDWHNSLIPKYESLSASYTDNLFPIKFIEMTWLLRLIGTALDKGDFERADKISSGKLNV